VAVVGDNTIDRYRGTSRQDYVGGNAVNVAVQLAERGLAVRYFGAVGPDPEGDRIRDVLTSRGVDVENLVTLPGKSALTVIRVDPAGDRHIEAEDFGVTAEYFPGEEEIARIASADWVQIGMLPRAGDLRRRLRASRAQLRIGQDCSVSDGYADLTVAFQSAPVSQAPALAAQALANGAGLAVMTLGPDGSTAYGHERLEIHQPALPVRVVDTTGAGDSFIAGFVSAFLGSAGVASALAEGARWAARTCTHIAGFPQPDGEREPVQISERSQKK
jgi:sugar/nucleoside kinase (ribokinase family)